MLPVSISAGYGALTSTAGAGRAGEHTGSSRSQRKNIQVRSLFIGLRIHLCLLQIIMKTIQIALDDALHARAKAHAVHRRITLTEFVRQALVHCLERTGRAESNEAHPSEEP